MDDREETKVTIARNLRRLREKHQLSRRSLAKLAEASPFDLREIEDANRARCRPLTMDEWSQRSAGAKYVDTVMRLTSALQ